MRPKPVLLTSLLALCLTLAVTSGARPAAAEPELTFTVNNTADRPDPRPGDNRCDVNLSRAGDQCTLRAAIMQANATAAPDTISIPAGTYVLTRPPAGGNGAGVGDLDITQPVTIVGVDMGVTIVDAGALDRVFEIARPVAVTISRLAIRNGRITGDGAGILNRGTLTLDNVEVLQNLAGGRGGGLFNAGGTLALIDSMVQLNQAGPAGGGLAGSGGSVTLTRTGFFSNVADDGGAIWLSADPGARARLRMDGSSMLDNVGNDDGGGLFAENADVEVIEGVLDSNQAGGAGGGILLADGTLSVDRSELTRNQAIGGGGAIAAGDPVTVTASRLEGNSARQGAGGAISVVNDPLILFASQVLSNTAAIGGGIALDESPATIQTSEIAFNAAVAESSQFPALGGGLYIAGRGPKKLLAAAPTQNGAAADVLILGGSIHDNRAQGAAAVGGGMYLQFGAGVLVQDTIVRNNSAAQRGGGIAAAGSHLSLVRVALLENSAGSDGGGLFAESGLGENPGVEATSAEPAQEEAPDMVVFVTESELAGNRAGGAGGGAFLPRAVLNLAGSVVRENEAGGRGGGLALEAGELHVASTLFEDNQAASGGGVATGGAFSFDGGLIRNNSASAEAGGLLLFDGPDPGPAGGSFRSVTVRGNRAGTDGGGIYSRGALASLLEVILDENVVAGSGAGMTVEGGRIRMTRGIVTSNRAEMQGGGIANRAAELDVVETTLQANAGARGGGALHSTGITTLTLSAVISNSASLSSGGGIFNATAARGQVNRLTVIDSTLSGNIARASGGGLLNQGFARLRSATIANNRARLVDGGGVSTGGTLSLANTLIGDNRDGSAGTPSPDCAGRIISGDYNLIEDIRGCTATGPTSNTKTGLDPLLRPLALNGGLTLNHALTANRSATSPAVDAGNPAGCTDPSGALLAVDQRLFDRSADGNGDRVSRCDIGAFEAAAEAIVGVSRVEPAGGAGRVGETAVFTLTWEHPVRWRDLATLDLRLTDEQGSALWVRFTEGVTSTFSLLDEEGQVIGAGLPGEARDVAGPNAILHLAGSAFQASGPDDPSVVVRFAVTLEEPAAGRRFHIELIARDDQGHEQLDRAGIWAIAPFRLYLPHVTR